MSDLQLLLYAAGYFGWFAYALKRFCHTRGDAISQALLTLMWPICVALYVPYRIARLVMKRPEAALPEPDVNFIGRDRMAMKVTCKSCDWHGASMNWDRVTAAYEGHWRRKHQSNRQEGARP